MGSKIRKRISAMVFPLIVFYKNLFFKKSIVKMDNSLSELLEEYRDKKKIVVFCSGPSANKVEINSEYLYLVTNDGYKRMLNEDLEYLLFLNDPFCVNRILADNTPYKKDQKILFHYTNSDLHVKAWNYLKDKLFLLDQRPLYFFLNDPKYQNAYNNFKELDSFYKDRKLEVRIQNSGMFLLLFGFYMAHHLKLPLEIYGLDLGEGGNIHFDSSLSPGESVTKDRVKGNVTWYLNFIYSNHFDVKNFSNFYGNVKVGGDKLN